MKCGRTLICNNVQMFKKLQVNKLKLVTIYFCT
jgi:hypothetical protein